MISSKLYEYLEKGGYLNLSDKEIAKAKKQYRKEYKRAWNRQKRKRIIEVTIQLSKKENQLIKETSQMYGYTKARFMRHASLEIAGKNVLIKNKAQLSLILQKIAMTHRAVANLSNVPQSIKSTILEAETLLDGYLSNDT